MPFRVEADESGVAVVEVSLTVTSPDLESAHQFMKKVRDAASEHGQPAAGDFITQMSVWEPDDNEER